MSKVCFIICWFGKLPSYIPIWLKSCSYNPEYDFLLITDSGDRFLYPSNVKRISFNKERFIARVKERLIDKPSLKAPYRLCDYRPMYGVIFREELDGYDYWGYCDVDMVFGRIIEFLPIDEVYKYEAVFNAGHFTLIKNDSKMNNLYKCDGANFDYKIVMKKDAIFAFDETTGIQRIARFNKVNCKFGIPYIETESKYTQLRSRMESTNPDHQAYYWENGNLYRVKHEENNVRYQKIVYIHLQKRKLELLDENVVESNAFWITPKGFCTKAFIGLPNAEQIDAYNPFEGKAALEKQEQAYKKAKIKQIMKRNPYQIYVRLKQQMAGINDGDGARGEMEWQS